MGLKCKTPANLRALDLRQFQKVLIELFIVRLQQL